MDLVSLYRARPEYMFGPSCLGSGSSQPPSISMYSNLFRAEKSM